MNAQLRSHLYHCAVGDQVVFMDLAAVRYFLASPCLGKAFLEWRNSPAKAPAEILFECKIVDHGVQPVSEPGRGHTVESSLLDDPLIRPSLGQITRAALFQLKMERALRTRPLNEIIFSFRRRKLFLSTPSQRQINEIGGDISGFQTSEMLINSDRKCLRRSLAMAELLLTRRFPADLVFGVRLRPFEAHCWLQHGPILLNDRVENVRLFTPIFTA